MLRRAPRPMRDRYSCRQVRSKIDTHSCRCRRQERRRVLNDTSICSLPPQPNVLHDVLRLRRAAEHTIGNPEHKRGRTSAKAERPSSWTPLSDLWRAGEAFSDIDFSAIAVVIVYRLDDECRSSGQPFRIKTNTENQFLNAYAESPQCPAVLSSRAEWPFVL
jgi:hypothetical protein